MAAAEPGVPHVARHTGRCCTDVGAAARAIAVLQLVSAEVKLHSDCACMLTDRRRHRTCFVDLERRISACRHRARIRKSICECNRVFLQFIITMTCCAGTPVVVDFAAPMSPTQQQWLRSTPVRVRRVAFHVSDAASAALLHDPRTLVS